MSCLLLCECSRSCYYAKVMKVRRVLAGVAACAAAAPDPPPRKMEPRARLWSLWLAALRRRSGRFVSNNKKPPAAVYAMKRTFRQRRLDVAQVSAARRRRRRKRRSGGWGCGSGIEAMDPPESIRAASSRAIQGKAAEQEFQ